MDVFGTTYSAQARLDAGYRTEGALDRSPWSDLATQVTDANQELLVVDRAWRDARRPVSKALGARDVAASALLETGRKVRTRLIAAGTDKTPPYTLAFPDGTPEYFEAHVDDQAVAYGLLADRMEANLAPTDPVRVELVPVLRSEIEDWSAAKAGVDKANSALALARDVRDRQIAAWDVTMLEVYGLLLPKVGKKGADRYVSGSTRRRAAKVVVASPPAPSVEPDPPAAS